jgi:hypothetical protein
MKPGFFSGGRQKILDKSYLGKHNIDHAGTKGLENKEVWSRRSKEDAGIEAKLAGIALQRYAANETGDIF